MALVHCKDEEDSIRSAALRALRTQRNLSQGRLEAIFVALLEDKEDGTSSTSMRQAVLHNLRAQPSLCNERLETMVVSCLGDWDSSIREGALVVLGALPNLSEEHLMLMVAFLQDSDEFVRDLPGRPWKHSLAYPTTASRLWWHSSNTRTALLDWSPCRP